MSNDLGEFYNDDFYAGHIRGMSTSAKHLLGILYKLYKPSSVLDIGCGRGAWLAAAEAFGSDTLEGIDGPWINTDNLASHNIKFRPFELDKTLPDISDTFDLCISLEVAEHISEKNAEAFIKVLCKASPVIIFGAAIKHQGGTNHINEQWQSYWISKFKADGYECFDVFRPNLWDNDEVEWWYRQNTFLFVKKDTSVLNTNELKKLQAPIIDAVHPMNYEMKIEPKLADPDFRFCFRLFKKYLRKKLRQKR